MISIIIPTYNEEAYAAKTVGSMLQNCKDKNNIEIIVSDGQSTDATKSSLKDLPVHFYTSPVRGRAAQMNFGATKAKGNIYFFLHADSLLPLHFDEKILNAINVKNQAGCFRLQFDHRHWFLQLQSWFTRFNVNIFRFGDQGLFVTKEIFTSCKGYKETHIIFEDQEIIPRLRRLTHFSIIPEAIITSARKYLHFGIFKTQFVFYRIFFLYKWGGNQEELLALYHRLLK